MESNPSFHLLLRCLAKTHAETFVESMKNLVELHSEKRKGLEIDDVGIESFIDWNGPPSTWLIRLV